MMIKAVQQISLSMIAHSKHLAMCTVQQCMLTYPRTALCTKQLTETSYQIWLISFWYRLLLDPSYMYYM